MPKDPAREKSEDEAARTQVLLAAYVVTLAVVVIALLAIILAFHYAKASQTTSVLGVVVPLFTAVIGVAVGGGAGALAGSAGKRGVQRQLSSATTRLTSIETEMGVLRPGIATIFANLASGLESPAGTTQLASRVARQGTDGTSHDEERVITEYGQLAQVTSSLGRIEGLLAEPT